MVRPAATASMAIVRVADVHEDIPRDQGCRCIELDQASQKPFDGDPYTRLAGTGKTRSRPLGVALGYEVPQRSFQYARVTQRLTRTRSFSAVAHVIGVKRQRVKGMANACQAEFARWSVLHGAQG
jgi:hypothetical protein